MHNYSSDSWEIQIPNETTAIATPTGPRNLFATALNAFVTAAAVQAVAVEPPKANNAAQFNSHLK